MHFFSYNKKNDKKNNIGLFFNIYRDTKIEETRHTTSLRKYYKKYSIFT